MSQQTKKQLQTELQILIKKAKVKVGAKDENDLCHYLPGPAGGYIHHFTYKSLKENEPKQAIKIITKHLIAPKKPEKIPPKRRAARGSRKKDPYNFSRNDLERMRQLARMAGDKEMIRKLTPRRNLADVKRQLISSIRHGQIEPDLWNDYVEAISAEQAFAGHESKAASPAV